MDLTAENELLDDQEFSAGTLQRARSYAIDLWNATPPQLTIYEVANFPARYVAWWRRQAAAEALRMAAFNYIRNDLQYTAGGVSVNDKAKAEIYTKLSQLEGAAADSLMHRIKTMLSIRNSFLYI